MGLPPPLIKPNKCFQQLSKYVDLVVLAVLVSYMQLCCAAVPEAQHHIYYRALQR